MAHFPTLDKNFRLQPWAILEHSDYVAGQYGAYIGQGDKVKAESYLKRYREKEAEFDAAYAAQEEFIRNSQVQLGQKPQELSPFVKIEWDPQKRFAKALETKVEKTEEDVPEAQKAEEKPKKKRKLPPKL